MNTRVYKKEFVDEYFKVSWHHYYHYLRLELSSIVTLWFFFEYSTAVYLINNNNKAKQWQSLQMSQVDRNRSRRRKSDRWRRHLKLQNDSNQVIFCFLFKFKRRSKKVFRSDRHPWVFTILFMRRNQIDVFCLDIEFQHKSNTFSMNFAHVFTGSRSVKKSFRNVESPVRWR